MGNQPSCNRIYLILRIPRNHFKFSIDRYNILLLGILYFDVYFGILI